MEKSHDDHKDMTSQARPTKSQDFWKFFKIWAGVSALPVLPFSLQAVFRGNVSQAPVILAPAVLFGAVGAAVMTFLLPPGNLFRSVLVGIVVGFVVPAGVFWVWANALPKNEATMGYYLAGMVFGSAGFVAGVIIGALQGSRNRV